MGSGGDHSGPELAVGVWGRTLRSVALATMRAGGLEDLVLAGSGGHIAIALAGPVEAEEEVAAYLT